MSLGPPGLLIAAPASGSGKTLLTLALLRHLRSRGTRVAAIKVGPDYIDPAFHAAASGRPCFNLDTWAMRPATVGALAARAGANAELLLGEGVMGLFDGAPDGSGSTADLSVATGWPVILVIDSKGMANSAAALLHGFATFRPEVAVVGAIFNRVGSASHGERLSAACAPLGLRLLGALPKDPRLVLPERHLGLVQAGEHPGLDDFLDQAAALVAEHLDIDALVALARPGPAPSGEAASCLPVLGQRIAVARDQAFAFVYEAQLAGWQAAGAALTFFSPLADQAPDLDADAVFLPGGYPELHGARLASATTFLTGLRQAADRGAAIYGECGGYMVLGERLEDGEGESHPMAGLLPLETSFAKPRLTLGYRSLEAIEAGPLGPRGSRFRGHEFHYARTARAGEGAALFRISDSQGRDLGPTGLSRGRVAGSFVHLVDRAG
ncbi:MAG: cobyrinate a,c-diamide synthase [Pseudomonadota bacterium]